MQRLRESRPAHRIRDLAHDHSLDQVVLTDDIERTLLHTARWLSAIVLAGSAAAFFGIGTPSSPYVTWEQTAAQVALTLAAVGLIAAWWWQPAAILALVAGMFVGAVAVFEYSPVVALGAAVAFMAPATLFLLAWQRTRSRFAVVAVIASSVVLLGAGGAVAASMYNQGQGAAHPQSHLEALPPSATEWVWSGAVTSSNGVVIAKVAGAESVRLAYATAPEMDDPDFAVATGRGPVYQVRLEGLAAATRYWYAVEVDGVVDDVRTGSFRTLAAGPADFSVAFGCSSRTGSNGAVFDTIRSLRPDLFLSTGDFNYGDVIEDSLSAFAGFYDVTLTEPAQAALYRSTPVAYVWDDHDFGPNDAAGDSPSRLAALVSYREHVPHYPLALDGLDAPVAQAFTLGRVRFILTDLRSARDPKSEPDGPGKSMLGEEQLAWFLDELTTSMVRYPLVVWVSSVPWIADAEDGADHWGGYAHEREEIAAAIAATGTHNVIILAGDAHMVAIDDGSNSPGGVPVMQAGALDRVGSLKGGPYSEGAFPGGGQFGLLTIEDAGHELHVRLAGFTWELEELVNLDLVLPADSS